MPLNAGMRARFKEELDAKGIYNFKEASLKAKWPDGTLLGATYIRDALHKEKRGSYQGVELECNANGLDWGYVKTGHRGNGEAPPDNPPAAKPRGTLEQALQALLAARRVLDDQIIAITKLLHGGE